MRSSTEISPKELKKVVDRVADRLRPGETITFVGKCMNIRPMLSHFIVTDARLIGVEQKTETFSYPKATISRLEFDAMRGRVAVSVSDGAQVTIKGIPVGDMPVVESVMLELQTSAPTGATPLSGTPSNPVQAAPPPPPGASPSGAGAIKLCGKPVTEAARKAIAGIALPDEQPWLIINPGGGVGVLVAFEDRLAIIKVGALTSFMAGSLMGGRNTVFYFNDITGIEYNSGLMSGVLEVLTASYQGSANKDFWKGTLKSRNADSNDPFTLSNTLPLAKFEYEKWRGDIAQLRKRIADSKRTVVVQAPTASSMSEEIAKLAQLHADGLLSDEEFATAKTRLISG